MRLFQLLLFRLTPLVALEMCKERKKMKVFFLTMMFCYIVGLLVTMWELVSQMKWKGIICFMLAVFPQCFFYGFVGWMLGRCIWKAWSKRVWERIFKLAFIGVILGILSENYLNSWILDYFVKKF